MLDVIYSILIGMFGALAVISFVVLSILLYIGYETDAISLLRIDDTVKGRIILFLLTLSFSSVALPKFNSCEDIEVKNVESYNDTFGGFARIATSKRTESDTVDYDDAFVLIINSSDSQKLVTFIENRTIIKNFITRSHSNRLTMMDIGTCSMCGSEINNDKYMVFNVVEPCLFGLVGISTEQKSVCLECMSEYMILAIQKEDAPFTENDLTAELL